MVSYRQLLALPPALLGPILQSSAVAHAQQLEWPYDLPPHIKYYPEHEGLMKRNAKVEQKLQQQVPTAMRKMSGDPGEKFMYDDWHFAQEPNNVYEYGNVSMAAELTAPLQRHEKHRRQILPRMLGKSIFDKRDYQCPAGSYACTSIDRSNSCCANGSTCQLIQDVGLGDVGCCPENEVCGGPLSACPGDGYTSCPQDSGGGCCLPGYACDDVGCIQVMTTVVVIVPTTSTTSSSTQPLSTSISTVTETTDTTTTIIPAVITSSSSSTTSTSSPSTTPPPTSTPNTLQCSSGFRSCPSTLGGGCCPTNRACGSDVCPELSSTNSFTAPGRPTSDSSVTTTNTNTFSSIPGLCPTGFYACSAYHLGGCCQTGRNCDTTSCPPGTSLTVVDGSSITVVASSSPGVTSVQTLLTGSCAQGWTTCGTEVGGGCCATGYACGSAACTASISRSAVATIGKIVPNDAEELKVGGSQLAFVVGVAVLFGIVV